MGGAMLMDQSCQHHKPSVTTHIAFFMIILVNTRFFQTFIKTPPVDCQKWCICAGCKSTLIPLTNGGNFLVWIRLVYKWSALILSKNVSVYIWNQFCLSLTVHIGTHGFDWNVQIFCLKISLEPLYKMVLSYWIKMTSCCDMLLLQELILTYISQIPTLSI